MWTELNIPNKGNPQKPCYVAIDLLDLNTNCSTTHAEEVFNLETQQLSGI